MTSLSILIPTQGRDTLERCLDSCVTAGLREGDEIIVIFDTLGMPDFSFKWTGKPDWLSVRWVGHVGKAGTYPDGHHCYGHCQLNHGLELAQGDYILCQDDDDVYAVGAFDRIRAQIDALPEPSPLLFRFLSFFGWTFWDVKGRAIENHIGGHCAVFPNDERLGRFTCRYQGDYDYIRSTLNNWGGDDRAVWVDDVIAIARPAEVTAG